MANSTTPLTQTAWLWQLALAGYWLALFAATHLPRRVASPPGGRVAELAHFLTYAVLAGLLAITWQRSAGRLSIAHLRWAWVALAVYAAFDELTQIPVGRTASWADWLADVLGALLGLALFWWYAKPQATALRRIQ